MELYQIVQLVLALVIAGLYIYKKVTGTDVLKIIVLSKPVVIAFTAVIEAVYKLIPHDSLRIIKIILDAAVDATEQAEKAWLMGTLTREERNPYAKALAREVLEKAGIAITERIEAIVNGVIEMTCMVLPHGVEPQVQEQEAAAVLA